MTLKNLSHKGAQSGGIIMRCPTIFITSNIWHRYYHRKHVGVWTVMPPFAQNSSAIAAVFAQSWGPVELDFGPRDSPKGLWNLGWVSGVNIVATPVAKDIWQIVVQSQSWLVPLIRRTWFCGFSLLIGALDFLIADSNFFCLALVTYLSLIVPWQNSSSLIGRVNY
jgi:hypothetical protein